MRTSPRYARPSATQGTTMPEPATTTASTGAFLHYLGLHIGAGALAASLGFLVLWPRTMKEGFARLFCTIVASSIFGPILVVFAHTHHPALFESAKVVAELYQLPPDIGLLFLSAPLLVIAGLPAWWLIGAAVRMFVRDGDSLLGALSAWLKRKAERV